MDIFETPQKPKAAAAASIAAALQTSHQHDTTQSIPIKISIPWGRDGMEEKLAFIVPNVLTENECNAIIQSCEERGFEQALLNVGGGRQVLATDLRKSGRCIIDDVHAAEVLMQRLKHVLPREAPRDWFNRPPPKIVGLNERFRVLKYQPGDYFAPHTDGSFKRPKDCEPPSTGKSGDSSCFTLMLYLNTPTKGGSTNFLSTTGKVRSYNPIAGQALIFDHSIDHEGAMLEMGVKYAIRTDVMYRRQDNA